MDPVIENVLLAPHTLAQAKLGNRPLTPQDVTTMSQLDPLVKAVISILNRNGKGDWISITHPNAESIQLPANSFLVVRSIHSGRVRDEEFVILDSSARTAAESIMRLSIDAQKELGLKHEGGHTYKFPYEYSVADSLDQVQALYKRQ